MPRCDKPFRLAPLGVARAAAWPLEALAEFGDPTLRARALEGLAQLDPPSSFVREYQLTLERERGYLWQQTFDDSLFLKGLMLSSPSAYLRATAAAQNRRGLRNRAMRLVEHTLYRYLARAAGRSTPQGVWAGITDVHVGAVTKFEQVPARCLFTPDLRPFQSLLRGLGQREAYRARVPWCLNPSLSIGPENGWRFFHRTAGGHLEERQLTFDPTLAHLLMQLEACDPLPLADLVGVLTAQDQPALADPKSCMTTLQQLAAGGVMVGALDLPTQFESAWDALTTVSDQLLPDHRREWDSCLALLREHCATLADGLWSMSCEDFATTLAQPAAAIATLAQRLGLNLLPLAEGVVRCDLRLPWRLTIDRALYAAIETALVEYDVHWQHGHSAAAAQRELRRRWFTDQLGDGRSLAEASTLIAGNNTPAPEWPLSSTVHEPEVKRRLAAWEACLDSPAQALTLRTTLTARTATAAPFGCWMVGLGAADTLRAHSVSDLPTIASARYGEVLDLTRFNHWLRAAFAKSSRDSGIALMGFRAPFETNPNALASPALFNSTVAPWAADFSRSLRGARLIAHEPSGQPVVRFPNDGHAWSVLALGTANLQENDVLAEVLLWTGFRDSPRRAQRAIDVLTAGELTTPRFTPRVDLPGGVVLCPRRSVIAADLAGLRARRGVARFWYWQQLAAKFDWPPQLEVATDRGGTLLVCRDSPLAVEALCKGLNTEIRYLTVQEAPSNAGLPLPGSGSHRVELAFPFLRQSRSENKD
ncbi:MAG: hypothetical protein EXR86_01325 [Gammaproteobacteria bacterium]|nr:hypothetical protein [Gammaproteobacteria bacterium]